MTRTKRTKNNAAANSQAAAAAADEGQDGGLTVNAEAGSASVSFSFPLQVNASPERPQRILPPGLRPVAMEAVSEKERRLACPHRHASALMHARARAIEEKARQVRVTDAGQDAGVAVNAQAPAATNEGQDAGVTVNAQVPMASTDNEGGVAKAE